MSSLRNAYDRVSGSERGFVLRNLTTDGLITGPQNANVNGAITPVNFYIQPLADEVMALRRLSVILSDSSSIKLEDYGSITGPLTNGIIFYTLINGVETEIGTPFKSNRQLTDLGPEIIRQNYVSSSSLIYDFYIAAVSARGIELVGSRGDRFGVKVRDDLSSLLAHTFTAKGGVRIRNI